MGAVVELHVHSFTLRLMFNDGQRWPSDLAQAIRDDIDGEFDLVRDVMHEAETPVCKVFGWDLTFFEPDVEAVSERVLEILDDHVKQ